ncbi:carbohydrate ABC transporter permease [Cohnella candidum]|uniref:carbohydrate ABC transporter permease n=1 Tax=Cohnella candidum TaxID=2674991 RepID=UPI001F154FD4|nr:carbohydrate ABC transporter permease [Cohnella candidum]
MKKSIAERGILSPYDYKKPTVLAVYALLILLVVIAALFTLYPYTVTILNSLKAREEVFVFPVQYWPHHLKWHNYAEAWKFLQLWHYLKNTIFIVAGNMAFSLVIIGLAAFSLAHLEVPKRRWFTMFFMLTLLIPPSTYIIPNFLNLKSLGLLNTFWAFWLPSAANAFNLLLIRSFFGTIHKELFESARLDGASELRCFFRIAVPLSVPVLITLLIFTFSSSWNDWFWPSLIMQKENMYPLASAVYKYVIPSRSIDWNVKFAVLVLLLIPPVLFFVFFQKYIVRGMNLGAVKG